MEEACRRKLLDTESQRYRTCYRAMPESVRSFLTEQLLAYRYRCQARERFGKRHPDALRQLFSGVGTVELQPDKLVRLAERTAERYQLGLETTRGHEVLCMDEGFAMRAVAVLWRRPSDQFSLDEYVRHTPAPDVLVHVRAPPDVCLRRQYEREWMGVREPWMDGGLHGEQARFADLCAKVADEQRSNTVVVTVDDIDTVEGAVERIDRALTRTLSGGNDGVESNPSTRDLVHSETFER